MEAGELHRLNSFSLSNSPVWKNTGMEVFSRPSQERGEDEEEALKWAALEKLPTFKRIQVGILKDHEEGKHREVDIKKLGPLEKRYIVDKLVRNAGEDNERFLLKLRQRIDRVGIELPTIEVRFQNLKVEAEAYVGRRALPTIFNFSVNLFEAFFNYLHIIPKKKKRFSILHDVSGIVHPGRLTLLLGPPSSGKSTLLLALSGKLHSDLKVSGSVTYNGDTLDKFVPQRSSAYISQHDLHLGELTVRETIAFSATCQGVGANYELMTELLRREKEANIKPDPDIDVFMKSLALEGQKFHAATDYVLKILGLDTCADTLVGDAMIRGISGGQRKRVTTAEMLVGPSRVLFMDEISTGLDSSTTFQIVNAMKQSIHTLQRSAVISLLQPPPETYNLFDDIILLSDGQIVYQGPCEHVPEFFESMGFRCPERKGVADFLQEVTSKKDQEQYWFLRDEPYKFVSAKEFSAAFQSFHIGHQLHDQLSIPFDKSKAKPATLKSNKYGIGAMELLKACASREWLLMKRNSAVHIFRITQLIFMATVVSTLFLRTEMQKRTVDDGGFYMGVLYFTCGTLLLNGMSEMSLSTVKLPVFYKQRDLLFFPAWAYALPTWILRIPITLIEVSIWVGILYYLVGFDPEVGRFFRQWLLLICVHQTASGLFRSIAAIGRDMIITNTFGSFTLLIVLVLGGFILSRDDVRAWWIWGYWISPMMYGQNAIAVNEFLGKSWRHVPAGATEPLGVLVLRSRGFFPEAHWYWIGVGALLGFMLLFNLINILALTYLKSLGKNEAALPEEMLKDESAENPGELNSNSNRNKGMVLPFEPLCMTYEDLRYAVDMPQEMKAQGIPEERLELLKGLSGGFRPGVLTALMGVSGAGKTTLMDVLAGRKTGGYIRGTITVSGYPKKQQTFARVAGYCEQFDIHSPHLTVYESLQYSAWLRLPPQVSDDTRKMFVDEIMELVELIMLRETIVGLAGVSGLSIEQRKRLTIAVELVANPSIIFMDEPTSGLDARAAAIVMRTVRNTVDTGRTVVCTIHQPSLDIFDAFDQLVLLKRGGEEIYVGPLGQHSSQLIEYFEGIMGVSKMKEGYNPATWMLEMTSAAQEAALGIDFAECYKNSDLYRRNKALIEELSKPALDSKDLCFPTRYCQGYWTQFVACLWKQHWSYWRNPRYSAVRLFYTLIVALMFGTIFWDLGTKRKKQQDLFNALGSMYAAVLFLGVQNASTVQPVVAIERTVFYREKAAGMYSALPYAFAQIAIELPYVLVQALSYGTIVYAMIGFEWIAGKFFWYLFFMYMTLVYYTLYGMMSVAVTPNSSIAAIASSIFYTIWNLFSGFIVPRTRFPVWWRWYSNLSPVYWTLYGLVASQYGDVEEELETHETVQHFIRSYFGFRREFLGYVALIISGFVLLFGFTFAYSIRTFNFQKR